MQDLENEEEVKLRADEFKQHPLFAHLSLYTEELKDYIEEKRNKQAEIQLQREQEKQTMLSVGGYSGTPSLLFSYADVMKVGGNIFCTQKILTNNSNLKPLGIDGASSSAPPKL